MFQHELTLLAPRDAPLYLWIEPWAEGISFPAGTKVELHASSPQEGQLEVEADGDSTAVYGWPGSSLRILVKGEVVYSSYQAVPTGLTKQAATTLFGPKPVPSSEERKREMRAWWKIW